MVPEQGYRLKKINEVIAPWLQSLEGMADGISPKNVQLVFNATIAETVKQLDAIIARQFAGGTD